MKPKDLLPWSRIHLERLILSVTWRFITIGTLTHHVFGRSILYYLPSYACLFQMVAFHQFFLIKTVNCISVVSNACHMSCPSNQPQFDYLYNVLCTVNTQHTSCLMYDVYWRCIIYYTDLIIHNRVTSLKFIPSWITLIILDEQYRSWNSLVHKFLCPSITSSLLGKLQWITRYDWYVFIYLFIYSLFHCL